MTGSDVRPARRAEAGAARMLEVPDPSMASAALRTRLILKKARNLPDDVTLPANSSISVRRLGQNRFQNGLGALELHFLRGRVCRKSGLFFTFGCAPSCSPIPLGANSKLFG